MNLINWLKDLFRYVHIDKKIRDTDSFMEWDELYNDLTYGHFGEFSWITSYGHRQEGRDEWHYMICLKDHATTARELPIFKSDYWLDQEICDKEEEKNITSWVTKLTQYSWPLNRVAGDGESTTVEIIVLHRIVAIKRYDKLWFLHFIKCHCCGELIPVLRDSQFRLVMLKVVPTKATSEDPVEALKWAQSLDWKKINART